MPPRTLLRRQSPTADLIKAHITLMEKEIIISSQADLFRLVEHHYRRLQSWHDQHTGWRIQRSSGVIRLIRHLSATTPGYQYERLREPRDFACLVWTLWYAENRQLSGRGNDQQFLLSQLAEQIQEQSTLQEQEAGFDFRRPADRYSIQRALQYLEDLGGLQLVEGQTREWVEQTPDADVLYEFTDIARSLVVALKPQVVASLAERLAAGGATLQPTRLPEASSTPALLRVWRALLLGPALFRFDDPAAFDELLTHADSVANELLETFGWLLDIHRDYACVVRASGMSMGPVATLTPYGTNDQIAMLLCVAMREQVTSGAWPKPDAYGCLHVTTEDMSDLLYTVRERYGEHWGNEARKKSAQSLLNDVYRKMRQIGILRGPDEIGNVLILPTAARYSATYEQESEETTPRSRSKESQGTKTRSRGKTTAKQITLAEAVAAIHSTKDSKNL
ncbi:MAG: TIGR02678 family protein [Chloroflexi bacterium]|nr:MAG: TIGR02678 family protein [Chloroflexota bacterium]